MLDDEPEISSGQVEDFMLLRDDAKRDANNALDQVIRWCNDVGIEGGGGDDTHLDDLSSESVATSSASPSCADYEIRTHFSFR